MTAAEAERVIRRHPAQHASGTMREIVHGFFKRNSEEFIRSLDQLNKAAGDTIKNPLKNVRGFDPQWEALAGELLNSLGKMARWAIQSAMRGL